MSGWREPCGDCGQTPDATGNFECRWAGCRVPGVWGTSERSESPAQPQQADGEIIRVGNQIRCIGPGYARIADALIGALREDWRTEWTP